MYKLRESCLILKNKNDKPMSGIMAAVHGVEEREERISHLKKVHGTDHSLCVCVCVCVCGDGLTLCNGVDRNLRN